MTQEPKSIKEIITRLNDLAEPSDDAHAEADKLLLDALSLLGQCELADAYMEAQDRLYFQHG